MLKKHSFTATVCFGLIFTLIFSVGAFAKGNAPPEDTRPKMVLDAIAESPDPFSPAVCPLTISAQYRILPTKAMVGAAKSGGNNKSFSVQQNIQVLDAAGELVRTLEQDFEIDLLTVRNASEYISVGTSTTWDGKNEQGTLPADGSYTYKITGAYVRINESAKGNTNAIQSTVAASGTLQEQVLLDATPPVITVKTRTPANNWGWNNGPVTVTYEVSDAASGVDEQAGGYEPDTVETEGANQQVDGSVTDLAGNTASITVDGINIDLTNPTITAEATGTQGENNWWVSEVTVSYTVVDVLSGIDPELGDNANDVLGEGANQTAQGDVYDKAGNHASAGMAEINVDWTPPTLAILAPADGTITNILSHTIVCKAEDIGGSGIDPESISAIVDGTDYSDIVIRENGFLYIDPLVFEDGTHSTILDVSDIAGNEGVQAKAEFVIDTVKPTISDLIPPTGTFTNNTQPEISATLDDDRSGIDMESVTISLNGLDVTELADVTETGITLTPEAPLTDGEITIQINAQDKAGNAANMAETIFTIDTISPTVAITDPEDGTELIVESIDVSGTYSDANILSIAVNSRLSEITDGQWSISGVELVEGPNTITAVAEDKAGNTGQCQITVSLITTPTIESIVPNSGTANGRTGITITGTNFRPETTATIGGNPVQELEFVSSTTLRGRAPQGEVGPVDVVVINPGNRTDALVHGFMYVEPLKFILPSIPMDDIIYFRESPITISGELIGGVPPFTGTITIRHPQGETDHEITFSNGGFEQSVELYEGINYIKVFIEDGDPVNSADAGGTNGILDTTPPTAPSGLNLTPGDGKAGVGWQKSTSFDVESYRIYKSPNGGGDYNLVKEVDSHTNAAVITLSNNMPYTIKVTAVDEAGHESAGITGTVTPRRFVDLSEIKEGISKKSLILTGSAPSWGTVMGSVPELLGARAALEWLSNHVYTNKGVTREPWPLVVIPEPGSGRWGGVPDYVTDTHASDLSTELGRTTYWVRGRKEDDVEAYTNEKVLWRLGGFGFSRSSWSEAWDGALSETIEWWYDFPWFQDFRYLYYGMIAVGEYMAAPDFGEGWAADIRGDAIVLKAEVSWRDSDDYDLYYWTMEGSHVPGTTDEVVLSNTAIIDPGDPKEVAVETAPGHFWGFTLIDNFHLVSEYFYHHVIERSFMPEVTITTETPVIKLGQSATFLAVANFRDMETDEIVFSVPLPVKVSGSSGFVSNGTTFFAKEGGEYTVTTSLGGEATVAVVSVELVTESPMFPLAVGVPTEFTADCEPYAPVDVGGFFWSAGSGIQFNGDRDDTWGEEWDHKTFNPTMPVLGTMLSTDRTYVRAGFVFGNVTVYDTSWSVVVGVNIDDVEGITTVCADQVFPISATGGPAGRYDWTSPTAEFVKVNPNYDPNIPGSEKHIIDPDHDKATTFARFPDPGAGQTITVRYVSMGLPSQSTAVFDVCGAGEVYLTFDDGPLGGTDDVIDVLKAEQVPGSFFFVGSHATSDWLKGLIRDAADAGFLVGNHSKSHTYNYGNPDFILGDFRANDAILAGILGMAEGTQFAHARFPGRNCWCVGTISIDQTDTQAAADLMKANGYKLYGWDLEWRYVPPSSASDPRETPAQMIQQVKDVIDGNRPTKTQGKVIILMHGHMFRASRGNKQKLIDFIQGLKNLTDEYCIEFKQISEY